MEFHKERLLLYAITDSAWVGKQTLLEQIEDALIGGATMVQLREKGLADEDFISEAIAVKKLCQCYNVPLIINDNLDVALKSGADGVHVGITDMSIDIIRSEVSNDFIIGATAKTVEQAYRAEAAGANYLGVGAIFVSTTKKNAIRITTEELQEICSIVSIPVVAIGGIDYDNMMQIQGKGIAGIAVISAIFASENIKESTRRLRMKVEMVV